MNYAFFLLISLLIFIILVIRNIIKAYVIYMLGDPTPRYRGLLSGNPLNHADFFGTLMLFLTPLMSQGMFIFGWTKYVDYDPNYFKNRYLGEFLVGFTGLGSFFIIIFLSKILAAYLFNFYDIFRTLSYMAAFLFAINLIPLKGFDGAIIFSLILRKINKNLFYKWEEFQYKNQMFILFLFFPFVYLLMPFFKYVVLILLYISGWI